MLKLRRSYFYALFVVGLLTLEFLYIEIGGGIARIYHFWSVVVVFFLAGSLLLVFRSSVFLALIIFAVVNLIAAFLSDTPDAALASLMSNYANLSIILAVALVLLRHRLSIEQLNRIILLVTMVSVAWGVIQILAVKAGLVLALSPEQEAQILRGFGPAFRTESNTFGKYMVLPFLLFLPRLLHDRRNKSLKLAYVVMIVGILMNLTRTGLYGIGVALIFASLWYFAKGQFNKVILRILAVGGIASLGVALILSGVVPISDYARYKLENFFNQEEVLEGSSSAYRLEAMQVVLDNTLNDEKRIIIGNGWGQTYYKIRRLEVQAGGGDSVNVLGYSGFVGLAAYLLYTITAFGAAYRFARYRDCSKKTIFAEGVMFSLVGMFATAQISGYLIAPEYYLLLGICVYLSYLSNSSRMNRAKVVW